MCLWLHALVVIRLPALTVTLTYALIQMVKKIAGKSDKARMITKARVTELIMSGGACLVNVWISARRNGDEDEDVFVFLLTGATSLYGFPLPLRQQLPQKSSQHWSAALRSISSTARDGVFDFFSSLIHSARSGAIV